MCVGVRSLYVRACERERARVRARARVLARVRACVRDRVLHLSHVAFGVCPEQ